MSCRHYTTRNLIHDNIGGNWYKTILFRGNFTHRLGFKPEPMCFKWECLIHFNGLHFDNINYTQINTDVVREIVLQ